MIRTTLVTLVLAAALTGCTGIGTDLDDIMNPPDPVTVTVITSVPAGP